jgi:DNA-binding transcriptional ArsR family regulator
MKTSEHLLYQAILDSLTPRERHTYFELVRLAAPEDTFHEEYQIPIPKGCCIISYRQLEKYLDLTRSTIRRALTRLVEKDLIELKNLGRLKGRDGIHFRTMYKIKHYFGYNYQRETENPSSPVEGIHQLETKHLQNRLREIESFRKQMKGPLSPSDTFLLDLIQEAYQVAKQIITAKDQYLSVQQGLLIENEEQDCQILIHGEKETVSGIDLQLKAILSLIDSIDTKTKEDPKDRHIRQSYADFIRKAAEKLADDKN